MEKYIYPAVFSYEEVIYIRFPDFPECVSDAECETEAYSNAKEVLELWLYDMECRGISFPRKSVLKDIPLSDNEILVLIEVSMPVVRDKVKNIYVKKTLTIPKWLDELGKAENVNFSLLLQNALKEYLGEKK